MGFEMKKVAALALAGVLAMGTAGCASGSGSASTSSAEAGSSASTTQSTSTAQSSATDGSTVTTTDIDESRYKLEYSDRDTDPSFDITKATTITLEEAGATASGSGASV